MASQVWFRSYSAKGLLRQRLSSNINVIGSRLGSQVNAIRVRNLSSSHGEEAGFKDHPFKECVKEINTDTKTRQYFSLDCLGEGDKIKSLPFCIRVLLESAIRNCDEKAVRQEDVHAILNWAERAGKSEVPFKPARVIMQDMSGGPCLMDLAAMRESVSKLGADPASVNPLVPVDLVIDHSIIADASGSANALQINMKKEFERNEERFALFKWASQAFENLTVVPPGTGIIHQVNLEYLSRCIFEAKSPSNLIFPDSMVGTDSHSTMVNGLGVVGWGVGGIEALSVILGQAIVMPLPRVLGVRLTGELVEGVMATDLVLQVVQTLREEGVVGMFVEFFGEGVKSLSLADRATIANMAPEYGATMGYFPPDSVTLDYYRHTGRNPDTVELAHKYLAENMLLNDFSSCKVKDGCAALVDGAAKSDDAVQYSKVIEIDLKTVVPSVSGPKRPHDRVPLADLKQDFQSCMDNDGGFKGFGKGGSNWKNLISETVAKRNADSNTTPTHDLSSSDITHGDVVVASITSCTNTSNPTVMIAAGLIAKKAVELGLKVPSYIKTSLSPGSRVVGDYLETTGLQKYLDELGFHVAGYGCMTCVGNSGELKPVAMEAAVSGEGKQSGNPVLAGVLSGNRNFEVVNV
eukprot:jgi/Bigna1/72652/fgenesh1_pg.20_\